MIDDTPTTNEVRDAVDTLRAENARLTRAVTTLDQATDELAASVAQAAAMNAVLRARVEAARAEASRLATTGGRDDSADGIRLAGRIMLRALDAGGEGS